MGKHIWRKVQKFDPKTMAPSTSSFWGEVRHLARPYYIVNIVLCLSFIVLKTVRPLCDTLFPVKEDSCELDMRENEVLFFLLIVVMMRSRKTGSTGTAASYLSSGFVYLLLFTLQAILLPEPTYKGPEKITYFRSNGLKEELEQRASGVTWIVAFYAAWSPASINFAPVFSKISSAYNLPNLKFGKIDVGRYPDVGEEHLINTSALTRQLPSVIMFQDGKETGRVPAIIGGKVQKFLFKEEEIINTFDLNNMYAECRKDKRYAAAIKQMEEEERAAKESKKKQ